MKQLILDTTGFPMIWVGDIQAYVHCLPVTKIQFEYFLSDGPSLEFNEEWYDTILTLNPRVSPRSINRSNYWKLFLTGIKPEEIGSYAEWCGDDYDTLNVNEWKCLLRYFIRSPFQKNIYSDLELGNRQEILLKKVTSVIEELCRGELSQAEQFFYRYGVMEWVRSINYSQDWVGFGQTVAGFQSSMRTADMETPEVPRNPDRNRLHYYGFRLIKRV
jgi:hypothetical protein